MKLRKERVALLFGILFMLFNIALLIHVLDERERVLKEKEEANIVAQYNEAKVTPGFKDIAEKTKKYEPEPTPTKKANPKPTGSPKPQNNT